MHLHATIFDYETGWKDLVQALSVATVTALQYYNNSTTTNNNTTTNTHYSSTCTFGGQCDITKSLLTDPVNSRLKDKIRSTNTPPPTSTAAILNVYTCQYCIAENVQQLRTSQFRFFAELFTVSPLGSMFVFTETTHRIWPELREVAMRAATEAAAVANITTTGTTTPPASPGFVFEIGFPSVGGRNKTGRQMVLRKVPKQPPKVEKDKDDNNDDVYEDGTSPSTKRDDDNDHSSSIRTLCEEFRNDNAMHQQRLKKGIVRQRKKRKR